MFPALEHPADRLALAFPERTLSYAALRRASHRVASTVTEYDRVAVLAEARIETCVAVIGALLAGVPAVPINPRSGASELDHIVSDAAPGAVLLAPGSTAPGALAGLPAIAVELDENPPDGAGAPTPGTVADPEAAALIVYTSGTTGAPKGAVLPRRAITSNLDALADAWSWTERDTVAHALPLFHVHGLVIGILGPLRRGGSVRHTGRFSPEAIGDALERGATMVFGVPTMYRRLAEAALRISRPGRLAGPGPPARVRLGCPSPRRTRAPGAAHRTRSPRALRHDGNPHEHRHPGRCTTGSGDSRDTAERDLSAARRRRRGAV